MAFAIACLLLAPCCGFLQRSRPVIRTISMQAKMDEMHNGLYDARGRACRGKVFDPAQTYYNVTRHVIANPAAHASKIRRGGYAPQWLFHYTTRKAAEAIMESSRLRASLKGGSKKDARFGDGIYLTSLPSWAEPDEILENNYLGTNRRNNTDSVVVIPIENFPEDRALVPAMARGTSGFSRDRKI